MEKAPDFVQMVGYIGLAMRAGQVISGEAACVNAIRAGKAAVALLDSGASENARKRLTDTCAYYSLPLVLVPEEMLQDAVGKPGRMALVLRPGGLADKVIACVGGSRLNG